MQESCNTLSELFVSVYSNAVRGFAEDVVRHMGRRCQKPLWCRELLPEKLPCDILYLDPASTNNDLVRLVKAFRPAYREYVVFKGERKIHIIAELHENFTVRTDREATEVVAERCAELDAQYRRGVFTAIESETLNKRMRYRDVCRAVKTTVSKGVYYERPHEAVLKRAWMDEVDVFVTDEFTQEAVLAAISGNGEPTVKYLGGGEAEIYLPLSSERVSCFIPSEKAYKEMLYAIYLWLGKIGIGAQAERVKAAAAEFVDVDGVFRKLSEPIRKRKADR